MVSSPLAPPWLFSLQHPFSWPAPFFYVCQFRILVSCAGPERFRVFRYWQLGRNRCHSRLLSISLMGSSPSLPPWPSSLQHSFSWPVPSVCVCQYWIIVSCAGQEGFRSSGIVMTMVMEELMSPGVVAVGKRCGGRR
jgi:hypothetical protein